MIGLYFLEKQVIPDMHDWDQVLVKDFPQQTESSVDCGVFLMKAIEYLALDNSFDFTQADITRFRTQIATSIISKAKVEEHFKMTNEVPKCEEGETIILI